MPKANRELARMRVVELYGQHLSERAIAKAIHKPNPFVHYWIRHYQLYGHVRDLPLEAHTTSFFLLGRENR